MSKLIGHALLVSLTLLAATPVQAATFSVNTFSDTRDVARGDGVCAASNGLCSLRAAIEEASGAAQGSDHEIFVPKGLFELRSTLVVVAGRTVRITGDGAANTIIDGRGVVQVLRVAGATLTISRVTIRRGQATANYGGAILADGPVLLQITDTVFDGNLSSWRGGAVAVRGLGTASAVLLRRTVFRNNDAGGALGGLGGGGGLYSAVATTIIDSTFSHNIGSRGAGALLFGRTEIAGSTFTGNRSASGGALNLGEGSITLISRSTLSGNIANDDSWSGSAVLMAGRLLRITDSTIAANQSYGAGTALAVPAPASVVMVNSILAANTAPTGAADCLAPLTIELEGTNLVGSSLGCTFGGPAPLAGTAGAPLDPRLGPLRANGGPTLTHLPEVDSPAVDTGGAVCAARDQRGVVRPRGLACDIGAVER